MNVHKHYRELLGPVYSWMTGDFEKNVAAFDQLMKDFPIPAGNGGLALDLGAGHGIQTVALARNGYQVMAVDFSQELLRELLTNTAGLQVLAVCCDMADFDAHLPGKPNVVVCWGDTLTHLPDEKAVTELLNKCCATLAPAGMFLLGFRDYTKDPAGTSRVIPVKTDHHRIMTCALEYGEKTVKVTDTVHERNGEAWQTRSGTYQKLRLSPATVCEQLTRNGLTTENECMVGGLSVILARNKA